jgi:hypothetical protein
MKKVPNEPLDDWKTIQFFLSLNGVCEVQVSTDKDMRCTCNGYSARRKCKHVNWCKISVKNDIFPINISDAAPDEDIQEANSSPVAFRELLLRYGKIVVL